MGAINREIEFLHLSEPHTASRATVTALVESIPGTEDIHPQHGEVWDFDVHPVPLHIDGRVAIILRIDDDSPLGIQIGLLVANEEGMLHVE